MQAGVREGVESCLICLRGCQKDQRQISIGGALDKWADDRPEELAKWVDENPEEGGNNTYLPPRVLRKWLLSDSEAAIDWWFERPHKYDRESQARQLMRHWADMDPVAAGDWLAAQDLDESYDGAIITFSGRIVDVDPERALAWALAIGGESARNRALGVVAKKWGKKDPGTAREQISAADLPAELKTKLLEEIDEK